MAPARAGCPVLRWRTARARSCPTGDLRAREHEVASFRESRAGGPGLLRASGLPLLALSLGPVQLIVRLLDELLQARDVYGKSGDAHRDRYGTPRKESIPGYALVLDPVAGNHIVSPRRLVQHASYAAQGLVTAPVSVAVVVRLEVVHIEHGAGEGQPVSPVEFYPPLRRPVEVGSTDQAGQVIHIGRPPQGGDLLFLRTAHLMQGQTHKAYGDQFGDVCGGVLYCAQSRKNRQHFR